MCNIILPNYVKSINREIALEWLAESLGKAEALSEPSVNCQTFLSQKPITVHNYLCILNGVLIDAKRYYNQLMKDGGLS